MRDPRPSLPASSSTRRRGPRSQIRLRPGVPDPSPTVRLDAEAWSADAHAVSDDDANLEPVEVPWRSLSADALRGLLEEFVTRDGTDYGVRERTLEERVRDVLRQVERGEVVILFDPRSGTANLARSRPRRP